MTPRQQHYIWIGCLLTLVLIGVAVASVGRNTTTLHQTRQHGFDARVAELAGKYGPPRTYCAVFYLEVKDEPAYGEFSATSYEPVRSVCLLDGKEVREWPEE